jgi:cobyrinic acid a,c-diamide synthase
LGTPVVLVVDATRSPDHRSLVWDAAPSIRPQAGGRRLNRVGTARQSHHPRAVTVGQESRCRGDPQAAIERLPSRHLGLVTPAEPGRRRDAGGMGVPWRGTSTSMPFWVSRGRRTTSDRRVTPGPGPRQSARIGVLKDRAFSFYCETRRLRPARRGVHLPGFRQRLRRSTRSTPAGAPRGHAAPDNVAPQALRKSIDEGLPVWADAAGSCAWQAR